MSGRRSPHPPSIESLETQVRLAGQHLRCLKIGDVPGFDYGPDGVDAYSVSFKHGGKMWGLSVAKDCEPGLLEHAKRNLLEQVLREIRGRFAP